VADTTTAPSPDFTVTKSIGATAENEIVVPRFPSTLGPATGDAQETLGLSTVRTLSGSPWLASASPEMLSPASTTIAMTKMRAAFGLPRRRCLAIRLYLLLCAATCWIPRHLQDKRNNCARRSGTCCAAGVGADRSARSCKWAVPGDLPGGCGGGLGRTRERRHCTGSAPLQHASARLKRRNVRHPRRVERPGGLRRYAIFYVFLPISQRRTRTGGDPVNSSTPGIHNFLDQIHSSSSLTTQAIRSAEGEPKWAPSSGRSIVKPGTTSAGRTVKRRDGNEPGPGRLGGDSLGPQHRQELDGIQ
jgi:hypothetical protein